MRNYAVMLCVATMLLAAGDLVADEQAAPASNVTREDAPGAARVYDGLLQKRLEERQTAFTQLSSPQKSAVWAHHLLTALAEHPEFTNEQRAVIQYALSVLTPTFAEIDPADPQWDLVVDQPLRELERRASAVFTRKQMVHLFGQLGPQRVGSSDASPTPTDNTRFSSTGRPGHIAPQEVIPVPQCHCNTSADFCDSSGLWFLLLRWRRLLANDLRLRMVLESVL